MGIVRGDGSVTDFNEELKRSGYIVFTNKGVSMMPLLRQDKDIIVIRKIEGTLHKNDVVLYLRQNGQYILHRITRVRPDGSYTIAGDNSIYSERVRREDILGILTEIRRDGKRISVSDRDYLRYVRTVPYRRLRIIARHSVRALLSGIYHLFVKKNPQSTERIGK